MDTKIGQGVVVGVDGSDNAVRAVRWAADEAIRRREPLRLVTAFGWTDEPIVSRPGLGFGYRDLLFDQSRQALATAVSVATERHPALEISHELRVGFPVATLVDEARRARLVVVGDRGWNTIAGLLAGSVSVALAAHTACPVVVVRGDEQPGSAALPILLGVDASPVSEAAIAFAYQAAAERAVPLVAAHSWTEAFAAPALTSLMYRSEDQAYEEELLAQRLAGWADKFPEVEVTRLVVHDRAAHLLIEKSRAAQLVVVGSRGHGEFAGLVLGSVSNALVHRSACPVAIVRPDAAFPR
jgi:nucleotide-binding universal stress UspA family protein